MGLQYLDYKRDKSGKKIKNLDFPMDFKEKASSIPDRTQDYIAYKLLVFVWNFETQKCINYEAIQM